MKAIEIRKLSKSYGDICAVKELDLEVNEGELFALLGVNGAGKTTTIKMLSGLAEPTGGGFSVLGRSKMEDIKPLINVLPQETAVAPNLTVRENLEFICGIYGFDRKESRARAAAMLEEFSMEEVARQKAKTLSGGWQRRLSIAMALIPAMLMFIAVGLICGTLLNDKQVGGICGALLTNLTAWLSDTWFDVSLVGGAFEKIANALPFIHAVKAVRDAYNGELSAIMPELWWVIGYATVLMLLAAVIFKKKMKI